MNKPIKTIHWNTGRQYSHAGQRITASLYSDGLVVYVDIDRNITGHYYIPFDKYPIDLVEITMQRYDNNFKEDWPGDESWAIIRDRYDETERAAWANDWTPEVA